MSPESDGISLVPSLHSPAFFLQLDGIITTVFLVL